MTNNTIDYVPDDTQEDISPQVDIIDQEGNEAGEEEVKTDTGTALVLPSSLVPADVFKKDSGAVDELLGRIKTQVRSEVFDISTEKGRVRLNSVARSIGGAKGKLKEMALGLTEDRKAQIKIVTLETTRMEKEFDKFRDEHLKPLTEWKEKQAELEERIKIIEALPAYGEGEVATVESLQCRVNSLCGGDAYNDSMEWGDFEVRAETAKSTALELLNAKMESTKKAIAEKEELETLRLAEERRKQKEREATIAAAAAATAKAVAEAEAEREAKAAADKVEADQIEAARVAREAIDKVEADRKLIEDEKAAVLAKAKADADRAESDRVAAEVKAKADAAAAVQAEIDKQAAAKKAKEEAEAAREADTVHRAKINNEILDKLIVSGTLNEQTAKKVISIIAKGELPHVSIQY